MRSLLIQLLFVFFIFTWARSQEESDESLGNEQVAQSANSTEQLKIQGIDCDPLFPKFSVGDFNLSDSYGFAEIKRDYKVFILSVSDSTCEECCKSEPMLATVSELLKNKTISFKELEIPIVRIDSSKFAEEIKSEEITLNRVPKTFLYYNEEYVPYEEMDFYKSFIHFLNRNFYPVVILKSKEDVEAFIDPTEEWVEDTPFFRNGTISNYEMAVYYPKQTRIVAFITDKNEYKEELNKLNNAARFLSMREDLRVARITNPKIVKEYKSKHRTKWFSDVSSNSIVSFVKNKNQENVVTHFYDLSMDNEDFGVWINNASVEPVEELFAPLIKITTLRNKPMFTAYLNRTHPKYGKDSKELVEKLKEIAKDYPQYQFTYTEDNMWKKKKEEVGIDWDEEPALAFNGFKTKSDHMNLKAFFDACWKGTVNSGDFKLPDVVRNYDKHLKQATKLTVSNYQEFLANQSIDRLLLVLDSASNYDKNEYISKAFGKTALRFSELKLTDKIELAFFDCSMQDLPKELSESKALPFMRFFPAGKQGGVEIKLSGFNIQQTMKLIQDNASNKFDLPKYAHLSPHEISQQPLGSKITAEEVIEAENKKKEADKKRDSKYIKEDL